MWPGSNSRYSAATRRDRLDRIKQGLSYRLIVAAMKTPFYDIYARQLHGPSWKQNAQLLTAEYTHHRPSRYGEPRQ